LTVARVLKTVLFILRYFLPKKSRFAFFKWHAEN